MYLSENALLSRLLSREASLVATTSARTGIVGPYKSPESLDKTRRNAHRERIVSERPNGESGV